MPEPTCRYCDDQILPTLRGRRPEARTTCGGADCQRQHRLALGAAWRDAHREKFREQSKAWKRKNPERKRATMQAWWAANRDRQYELNRAWRAANPERQRELERAWDKRNKVKRSAYSIQRRGWKMSGVVLSRDWERLCNRYERRCAYCGLDSKLTVDHVIPLARGGRHTIGNVLPACHSCNSSKQDRLLVEWRVGRAVERKRRVPVSGR